MSLPIGMIAPDFELMTQDPAKKVKLSDLRGKKVVLLFYPMDFSPVCTKEHCTFGPAVPQFAGPDAVVFGVSCDSPFTHAAYKAQYQIPYDLLSDPTRKMVKAYNLFLGEEPFNCGKRGTVVIDPDGKIAYWKDEPTLEERTIADLRSAILG